MEETYPTLIIKVIGETSPFRYEVSLIHATNGEAPTSQGASVTSGTYDTIEEVIGCFEWKLPERVQELIRDNLTNARGVKFNLRDAYASPE